ncbi:hypothetical protein BDR04DRAFT_1165131 [Suillus decipiens]|nr:hypothetical protein BDR04DRAFT_1165131 [Suillus decipiens]
MYTTLWRFRKSTRYSNVVVTHECRKRNGEFILLFVVSTFAAIQLPPSALSIPVCALPQASNTKHTQYLR